MYSGRLVFAQLMEHLPLPELLAGRPPEPTTDGPAQQLLLFAP